jgi:hypothetical protein
LRKTKYESRAAIIHNEEEVEKKRAKPLLNLALIAGPSPREALIAGPSPQEASHIITTQRAACQSGVSTPVAAKGQFYKSRYVDSNSRGRKRERD